MPESTLTPAPLSNVTFPGARKSAMRSTAAECDRVGLVCGENGALGMVGTETRIDPPDPPAR